MRDNLICLVDWVGVTLKTGDLGKAYELLGIPETEFIDAPRGMHGYTQQRICGSIRILFAGNADMGIHIQLSGQGCREFETYYQSTGGWESFFARLLDAGGTFSRLDLAVDEIRYDGERPYFTVPQVIKKTKAGHCRSKFRTAQRIEKIAVADGSSGGHTIYFGSPHSLIQFRVYEKDKERLAADKELEADLTTWNRFELQLADDRAQTAVEWLTGGFRAGELIFGVLSNYINFCQPNDDSNKARWPICGWWLDWLDGAEKLRLAARAPDKTIDSKQAWLSNQTYPTMAEIWVAHDSPGEEWFVAAVNEGLERMTDQQWQRALDYRDKLLTDLLGAKQRHDDRAATRQQRYLQQMELREMQIAEHRIEAAAALEARRANFYTRKKSRGNDSLSENTEIDG